VKDGATQPLVALIFSGSLSELKGKYESLSYVWGSEEKPKSIKILFVQPGNDANEALMFECNITKNLWIAFTDLRHPSRHRDIWTDALCVNQDDNPEKNIQVAQMRDVYAGSKKTMAHLGPHFDGSDALVAFRDSYLTKYWFSARPMAHDHWQRGQYMLLSLERGIVRANQHPGVLIMVLLQRVVLYFVLRYVLGFIFPTLWAQTIAVGVTTWEIRRTLQLMFFKNKFFSQQEQEVIFTPEQIVYGMNEFFTRPWFRRVWIIQECVVSPKLYFMISREEFDILEIVLMLSAMRELKAVAAGLRSDQIVAFERMWRMRNSGSKDQPAPSLSTFLMWAWSAAVGQEATNPRDRIYALLGLVEKNPAYFVDYTLEAHEVFWRYARILIQSPEGFMLLEDPRRHGGLSMPSWVPDFAQTTEQSIYGPHYLYSCSNGVPLLPYQLGPTDKSIEVSSILLAGVNSIGRQYATLPEEFRNLNHFFAPHPSRDSLERMIAGISALKVNIEPRDDIKDIMKKNPSVRLPKGLDSEAAAEVLLQIGIFLDQTEGSLGAPTKHEMYPVEKFPDAKHTHDLIAMTAAAARYSRLYAQGQFILDTPEDNAELIIETDRFFTECSNDPGLDRSRLFQRLTERSHIYPRMCRDPLFRALSQEEWPPESMKDDESIPDEIYNDDSKLFAHWVWSFSYLGGSRAWAGRRLAITSEGYMCNADKDTHIGDRIAVVAGCRMPLILRAKDDGTYKVIGHAYVMGLMYGEVMEVGIEPEQILLS
jgi:hypothetical protein